MGGDLLLLTYTLEFLLELRHVVAIGDVEVEFRVVALQEYVGRVGGAYGEDGRGAVGALHLTGDGFEGSHGFGLLASRCVPLSHNDTTNKNQQTSVRER